MMMRLALPKPVASEMRDKVAPRSRAGEIPSAIFGQFQLDPSVILITQLLLFYQTFGTVALYRTFGKIANKKLANFD